MSQGKYTQWVKAHPAGARQLERVVTSIRLITSGNAPFQIHSLVETVNELLPFLHDRVLLSENECRDESPLSLYYQLLSRTQVFLELSIRFLLKRAFSKTFQWKMPSFSFRLPDSSQVLASDAVPQGLIPDQVIFAISTSRANTMANRCVILFELVKILLLLIIRRHHVTWAFTQLTAPHRSDAEETTGVILVPHVVESKEDLLRNGVTPGDRLLALLELLDYAHSLIPALFLVPVFGKSRSAWDRWLIWFLVLLIINAISTALSTRKSRLSLMIGKPRALFAHDSSIDELADANITRRFLIVEHLLRDPAFRRYLKPIVFHKLRHSWFVRRVPLVGTMLGNWIDHRLALQRHAFTHAQIDTCYVKP